MVDMFTASPLTAAAMQWFTLALHMTDFNWTPLTGGLAISTQAWMRIPAELNHVDAAQLEQWHKLVERTLKIFIDNPISGDIYEQAASYLVEYRKAHGC
jgi:hypothetical protein